MKGGKDEGKSMDPLFPRLHISDADKGGPKAPPRNKMALCEQYSVPSQSLRFASGSMTMLPLPTSNGGSTFASKASSSQIGCFQKTVFPTFCSLPGSSHVMERYHAVGVNLNMALINSEPRTLVPANYQNSSALGSSMLTAGCNLSWPHGFSNNENCCMKPGDENDIRVLSFVQSGIPLNYGNLQPHLDKEKVTAFSSIFSGNLQTSSLKLPRETGSADLRSREHQRNQTEKDDRLSQMGMHHVEKPVHILSTGEKSLADAVTTEDGIQRVTEMIRRKRSASATEDSSHFVPLLGANNKGLINLESVNESSKNKDIRSSRVGNVNRKQDISETSVACPLQGLDLAPDDVVGAIGLELFWKARSTIVDQQRIFAVQIFELHRLIQVQRSIAGSPEVMYENICLGKPPIKLPAMNKLLRENVPETPPTVAKPKADPQKLNPSKDHGAEAVCGTDKGHLAQKSTHKPSPTTASIAIDAKVAPWCFHPPSGNQWLVPVRSPTEGLIYKPYTGLCPPTVGFMAPVYGNCGPISLNAASGTAYGVLAPNQQGLGCFSGPALSQNYFQQCAMPLITANSSNLEVEQLPPFFRDQLTGPDKHPSACDLNFSLPYQSSCNVSSQQSGVISDCGGNLHASKESDMQGSTASSPEWLQGEGLSLFPTTPTLKVSNSQSNEQQTQVIKVVPHNPKSASDSVARIFQSIQEERKKHQ
ncbi:Protein EARLY FLOWERING 3 [Abeliophyllum distichum]|uniref:Protein EARLY FLOWERING 3 n=1 Tax=Abeliophyllum distichum TaxID=126358 RepID=A0ABD1RZX2_9LAMI